MAIRIILLIALISLGPLIAAAESSVLRSAEKGVDATTQASPQYQAKGKPEEINQGIIENEVMFKMLTIKEGMSEEEVRAIMGQSAEGSSATWEFLQGAITFEDGKVKSTTVLQQSIRDLLEQLETDPLQKNSPGQ